MTHIEYIKKFEELVTEEIELTKLKNGDYAQPLDAFANFRRIEDITAGRISVEDGILCRITDKISRVASLLANPANVKEESLEDNLKDISVYCRIWRIYRRNKISYRLPAGTKVKIDPLEIDLSEAVLPQAHIEGCILGNFHSGYCKSAHNGDLT